MEGKPGVFWRALACALVLLGSAVQLPFELGVGPNIVIVDAGMAKTLTTTTGRDDVCAFIFGQKGLMAGIGLQGSKITRVSR